MSTEHATEEVPPAVAEDECNQTTTLAVVPEQTSTTIPLERQRIVLEQWEHRRDLHLPTTKSFKLLQDKCAALRQKYEMDLQTHRGRLLLLPKTREAANLKRKATLKDKHDKMVADVVRRVTEALGVDAAGKKKAAAAVADLLESAPEEKAVKKKAKAKKRGRTEVEEESD